MENSEIISNAMKYICSNNGNGFSLEDVADNAGFSLDYFNKVFLRHTGYSVMEYARFVKLKWAAFKLRTTERSVLDIALDCGYDAPESFSRAFSKQYGVSPSEYRKEKIGQGVRFADRYSDDTPGHRFVFEHPEFRQVDRDEAIDALIEKDSRRFAYEAVSADWNGSSFVTDENSEVLLSIDDFSNFGSGLLYEIICSDARTAAKYFKKLDMNSANIIFDNEVSTTELKKAFEAENISLKELTEGQKRMYFGEKFELEKLNEPYSARPLTFEDAPYIKKWGARHPSRSDWGLCYVLEMRDVRKADETELPIGLFKGDELIAVARLSLQQVRGIKINNCITTVFVEDESDEFHEYLYKMGCNEALEKGYIPFEDVIGSENCDGTNEKRDHFSLDQLGFEKVGSTFTVSR